LTWKPSTRYHFDNEPEIAMATLIVRQVDERIVQALRDRAKRYGRSAEAEHRAILEAGLGIVAPSMQELRAFFRRGGQLGLAEVDWSALPTGGPVSPIRLDDEA
jgi:plasmid stability protein